MGNAVTACTDGRVCSSLWGGEPTAGAEEEKPKPKKAPRAAQGPLANRAGEGVAGARDPNSTTQPTVASTSESGQGGDQEGADEPGAPAAAAAKKEEEAAAAAAAAAKKKKEEEEAAAAAAAATVEPKKEEEELDPKKAKERQKQLEKERKEREKQEKEAAKQREKEEKEREKKEKEAAKERERLEKERAKNSSAQDYKNNDDAAEHDGRWLRVRVHAGRGMDPNFRPDLPEFVLLANVDTHPELPGEATAMRVNGPTLEFRPTEHFDFPLLNETGKLVLAAMKRDPSTGEKVPVGQAFIKVSYLIGTNGKTYFYRLKRRTGDAEEAVGEVSLSVQVVDSEEHKTPLSPMVNNNQLSRAVTSYYSGRGGSAGDGKSFAYMLHRCRGLYDAGVKGNLVVRMVASHAPEVLHSIQASEYNKPYAKFNPEQLFLPLPDENAEPTLKLEVLVVDPKSLDTPVLIGGVKIRISYLLKNPRQTWYQLNRLVKTATGDRIPEKSGEIAISCQPDGMMPSEEDERKERAAAVVKTMMGNNPTSPSGDDKKKKGLFKRMFGKKE